MSTPESPLAITASKTRERSFRKPATIVAAAALAITGFFSPTSKAVETGNCQTVPITEKVEGSQVLGVATKIVGFKAHLDPSFNIDEYGSTLTIDSFDTFITDKRSNPGHIDNKAYRAESAPPVFQLAEHLGALELGEAGTATITLTKPGADLPCLPVAYLNS